MNRTDQHLNGKNLQGADDETVLCIFGPAHGRALIVRKGQTSFKMRNDALSSKLVIASEPPEGKILETTYHRVVFPVRTNGSKIIAFHIFVPGNHDAADILTHCMEAVALLSNAKDLIEFAAHDDSMSEDRQSKTWNKHKETAKKICRSQKMI